MRSMKLAAILALFAAGQALGAQEVVPELLLGGDNQAATVQGGFPAAYDTSGATTADGTVVTAGDIVSWAVNVTVSGTGGDLNNGGANLVVDLELSKDGSPVAGFGGIADGCTGGTGSFCSTMNDGSAGSPAGSGNPQLASFALTVDSRAFAVFFGAPGDPLPPPISGSIVDDVADDGANMDYHTYPSAMGFPAGSTATTGVLVGQGAGYSSFTTPSDNSQMDDGNFAGVGCVGDPGSNTCGAATAPNLGNGPFFEGQVNTAGLGGGTYTLTVNVEVAGNNVLDGAFDPLGGAGSIPSFAEASTVGGSDTITFVIPDVPALQYAASRKDHVGATTTTYDIDLLNPTNSIGDPVAIGVESRGNGVIDRLVLGFGAAQTASCGALIASLSGGVTCTGVTDLGGNQYEVALSGGVNNSCLTVTLATAGGETIQALNILGDANASGGVTIGDLSAIKAVNQAGGLLNVTNARTDVNLSNGVTIADLSAAKGASGGTATCP